MRHVNRLALASKLKRSQTTIGDTEEDLLESGNNSEDRYIFLQQIYER